MSERYKLAPQNSLMNALSQVSVFSPSAWGSFPAQPPPAYIVEWIDQQPEKLCVYHHHNHHDLLYIHACLSSRSSTRKASASSRL